MTSKAFFEGPKGGPKTAFDAKATPFGLLPRFLFHNPGAAPLPGGASSDNDDRTRTGFFGGEAAYRLLASVTRFCSGRHTRNIVMCELIYSTHGPLQLLQVRFLSLDLVYRAMILVFPFCDEKFCFAVQGNHLFLFRCKINDFYLKASLRSDGNL